MNGRLIAAGAVAVILALFILGHVAGAVWPELQSQECGVGQCPK